MFEIVSIQELSPCFVTIVADSPMVCMVSRGSRREPDEKEALLQRARDLLDGIVHNAQRVQDLLGALCLVCYSVVCSMVILAMLSISRILSSTYILVPTSPHSCAHVTTLLCPHHHTLLYPHPNTHTHLRLYRIRKIALSTLMSARITSGLASNFSRSGVHTSLRSSGFWSAMNLYIGVCFMNYVTIPHSRPRSSRCRDDGR